MLTLENILLAQGGFQLAADLEVREGALVAVIGPSGAGKSTLLSAIAGFLRPSRGRVSWQGTEITQMEPGQRPVSTLFQDNNLFPHLSAFDNVALGMRPNLRLSATERGHVQDVLHKVGLDGLADRLPKSLSGGQQSRLALARVLLRARPLLLLDEPFSALGPGLRQEMLELLGQVAEETGATVLMVTHEPEDARAICDQTIYVDGGMASAPQHTAALLDDPPDALRAYLK